MDPSGEMTNSEVVSEEVSDSVGEDKMIYPFTRAKFLQSLRKQSFPFRCSLMHYIAMNPTNPKTYGKLIMTCKFFFFTNSVIVVSSSEHFYEYKKEECRNKLEVKINRLTRFNNKSLKLGEISSKIWLTKEMYFSTEWYNTIRQKITLPISTIYRSDVERCELYDLDIPFKEFTLLTPKCKELELMAVTIFNDDESVVPLEKLVEALPLIRSFVYNFYSTDVAKIVTSATVKNLLQIPHFPSLKNFALHFIPEAFDIRRFFAYIKENKTTHMQLEFEDKISQEYAICIEAIVREIIRTKHHNYVIPWFFFNRIDGTLYNGLYAICDFRFF